jgi:hypothetical protein
VVCSFALGQKIDLPPMRTALNVGDQPVTIVISGSVMATPADRDHAAFHVTINADLGDLQDRITPILQAQLNRDDRCGERLSIQQATLVPSAPAGTLNAGLHYEKWACVKAFGKNIAKKLAGGDGTVQVRLTPAIRDGDTVRLDAQLGEIQADGSIGELLRSPSFADALRERITRALEKVPLEAAIPSALRNTARIDDVSFADAAGRLTLKLRATVTVPARDAQTLLDRLAKGETPPPPAAATSQPDAPAR